MSQKCKTNTLEALETILHGSDLAVEHSFNSSVDFEVDEDEDLFFGTWFNAKRRQDHLALKGPSLPLLQLRLYLLEVTVWCRRQRR
ncbi:hypothetical protein ILYODFUR_032400 [Ilyodon furcidens]|uniref:Uncharacterized protein n=1 Tax=Ilyodon furcidens TaxID=33524 RepID=A0ABV0UAA1_9TELE